MVCELLEINFDYAMLSRRQIREFEDIVTIFLNKRIIKNIKELEFDLKIIHQIVKKGLINQEKLILLFLKILLTAIQFFIIIEKKEFKTVPLFKLPHSFQMNELIGIFTYIMKIVQEIFLLE